MTFSPRKSNSWVLVTGASSGIGESFARRFVREGWNMILVSRSEEPLQSLARELKQRYEVETLVIASDLTKPESPRKIYDQVKRASIDLYGLINNAGCGTEGRFREVPLERYLAMMDLNVRALVELTHLFLRGMVERKQGFIVNVSSTASFQPMPYSSIYAASKSFVTSFTEALWLESKGTGVRVLNLCPGVTKTNFGKTAGYRDFHQDPFAEAPERVVDRAFRALKKGNAPTIISGWKNRLLVTLERFVPHRFLLFATDVYKNMEKKRIGSAGIGKAGERIAVP